MKAYTTIGYLAALNKRLAELQLKATATLGLDDGPNKSYDINDCMAGIVWEDDKGKSDGVSLLLTNPVDGNALLFYIIAGAILDVMLDINQDERNMILVKLLNNGEPEHIVSSATIRFSRNANIVAFDVIKSDRAT